MSGGQGRRLEPLTLEAHDVTIKANVLLGDVKSPMASHLADLEAVKGLIDHLLLAELENLTYTVKCHFRKIYYLWNRVFHVISKLN